MKKKEAAKSPLQELLRPTDPDKKERGKSPLRQKAKKAKRAQKKKRLQRYTMIGASILLMVFVLLIISFAFLVAPSHSLKAKIRAVRGGYELTYEICQVNTNVFSKDVKIGDTVYMSDNGTPAKGGRNAIKMKVVSIDNSTATLAFDVKNIPDFISTTDMKTMVKSSSSGQLYNHIYVVGKVMGGKFTLQQLRYE